jgi:hypothetical protein
MANEKRRDGMQRVRVGLTGLAVVLLIVALATAVLKTVDEQVVGNSSPPSVDNSDKSKDEPLADLGVAPGAPAENVATSAPTPPKP